MSQQLSPWRVNDAVLYDALRDELRSAIASVMATADGSGDEVVAVVRQSRSEMYGTDGFDRDGIASRLEAVRASTRTAPERSRG
ncbi:hypothetical protein QF046_001690 [Microbacterium sp. W4I4]|uniref:hypothetical protein n=1 Tax=Microbacterium sp. W4I4 TaxID=3042295 RepID=UPI00278346B8|nr:hypothetical protein [Microbacterium sp. W4I4]MDQ0614049.1 hypothetical protein [Microbacterium sp. W4I4]